ncbi:MAG: tetratricopeptide repeat protein [Proteobacteria bacterium]|jgi:tetratricopeptide (TPR) repeat protein|nr:tetratricopeptide repeat protein [Desulfocapsa sp.]MBU3946313.1 tetratricopeptide repeat protein [Pseudomonadota bacterium]MBU4028200.1 tetratricopeptide repeat protein [Pseudomonadota bacterium]MBU4041306.1 tetratricopeptide repeat protein [Pseudomonadota bacterium]MBU4084445.1 tetratricopeptide repeat protein [Pseudomonadota bacterium]
MKLKKSALLFLCFVMIFCTFLGTCLAGDRENSQNFLEANRAYEAGDLTKAIRSYEDLVAHAGVSASLCYNLANSYARTGQTGKAVLEYERALLLAPGNADIHTNLERLRREKGLFQKEIPWWQKMGGLLGLNQWTVLAAIMLLALALFHLATLRFVVLRRFSSSLTAACLVLLCLCSAGVAIQYRNWQQAVIIAPDTGLLISPFDGAGSTGAIEEGRLIRIIKRHDSYALINDENGRSGWVPDSSFAFIAMIMADNKKPL